MRLGIDPGITGAIAFLSDDLKFLSVEDMPTMTIGSGKRQQVNAAALVTLIEELHWEESGKGLDLTAYVEHVSAMPGQGVSSMFGFGMSYGIIQGVLASLSVPMVLVTPQVWKKRAGLTGKDKDAARTLAQQLYPTAPLGKKRDVGRADAILIARYGTEKERRLDA